MLELTTPHSITENLQFKAKTDLTNEILEKAEMYLKGSQLMELNRTLNECFENYEIFIDNGLDKVENYDEFNQNILHTFISTKKIEGLSPRSLTYYEGVIASFLEYINCTLPDVSSELIREYLVQYQQLRNCSNSSLDNIRRIFSTFFNFCQDEGFLQINPMRRVKKIKSQKKVKKGFTDIEIEKMRDYLSSLPTTTEFLTLNRLRDRALFELLLSSGIRIQECVQLKKSDMDMESKSFKVLGKGNKERICYFSSKTKYWLSKLFDYKPKSKKYKYEGDIPLFINYKTGNPLGINGIERKMREMGYELGIQCHPHKFRRTFATNLIRKEVPIEQVRDLMGHSNMDTTLIYAQVDQDQVKLNHNRFSG